MSLCLKKGLWALSVLLPFFLSAQPTLLGQEGNNPITVAVPFVSFAPDSRGSAMGDAGVASTPDGYSVHWNNAKLAFIENDMGFSFSYSPWLGNIVDDMSLNYLTFYYKLDRTQALGVSMRYFDLGEIFLTDIAGADIGTENPRELAIDATYSRKLTENFGIGVTGRYIWSNITGNLVGANESKAGTSVAIDLGLFYTKPMIVSGKDAELSLGAHISNFGQKVTYSTEQYEDFIPANLRLGSGYKMNLDPFNSISFLLDFNKLLVPTPPTYGEDEDGNEVIVSGKDPDRSLLSGTFGSFSDAPGGFSEELKEITISFGTEYKYKEVFALRAGYFYENDDKGGRKYFTAGLGFKYQVFGVDFSYLIPQEQNNPLANTLRVSLVFNFDLKDGEAVTTN